MESIAHSTYYRSITNKTRHAVKVAVTAAGRTKKKRLGLITTFLGGECCSLNTLYRSVKTRHAKVVVTTAARKTAGGKG